jgi:hypothetical protein
MAVLERCAEDYVLSFAPPEFGQVGAAQAVASILVWASENKLDANRVVVDARKLYRAEIGRPHFGELLGVNDANLD